MTPPLVLRLADSDSELALVRDSWRKSFLDGIGIKKGSRGRQYLDGLIRAHVIEPILARETARVLVAVEPESNDVVGYTVTDTDREGTPIIHYVFVKMAFRREFRIATTLLESLRDIDAVYTHHTFLCDRLPIPARWQYRPIVSVMEHHE